MRCLSSKIIGKKTFKEDKITPKNFPREIRSIEPDVKQFADDTMREELIERGYDIPLNKCEL